VTSTESLPLLLSFLAWPALGLGMAAFRRRGSGAAVRRDPLSLVGLLVQALAFGLAFLVRRRLDPAPPSWEVAVVPALVPRLTGQRLPPAGRS
jgi:hypothetical protein